MWWNMASPFYFIGKLLENGTTIWPEFSIGVKALLEQILVSEKRNKSKRAGLL